MKLEHYCKRIGLKGKSRGSVVEQGLIIATIVTAAIVGLGYLGLAVQNQLNVLVGATESGTEIAESEAEATESPSIGDPPGAGYYYYLCKDLLLTFAANPAYAEHSEDRADALYNITYQMILDYFRVLSVDQLRYLGLHALNVLGDPPNVSETYKEHKQAMLDIYDPNKLEYIRAYNLDNLNSTIEQKYLSSIKSILSLMIYFSGYFLDR